MITAVHTVIYARNAGKARAFFRDTLGLSCVDAGHGWLIFALPPGELGIHPTESEEGEKHQQLYLMCDNLEATVAELKAKGVAFTSGVTNAGWGLLISLAIPGGGEMSLYEPRHASPLSSR